MKRFTVEILAFMLLLPVEGLIVWHSVKTGENNIFIPVLIGLIIFMVIFFSLKNFSDYRTEKGERSVLLPIVYGTFIMISTIVSLAVIVQLYITASTLWTLFGMTCLLMLWYSFYLDKMNADKGNKSIYINYIAIPTVKAFSAIAEIPVLMVEEKKQKLNIKSEIKDAEEVQVKNPIFADDGFTASMGTKLKKDFSEFINYIESRELDRLDEDTLNDLIFDLENSAWNGKYSKSDVNEFIVNNYSQDSKGFYMYKGLVNKG